MFFLKSEKNEKYVGLFSNTGWEQSSCFSRTAFSDESAC